MWHYNPLNSILIRSFENCLEVFTVRWVWGQKIYLKSPHSYCERLDVLTRCLHVYTIYPIQNLETFTETSVQYNYTAIG